jgi:hypothetical protein
MRALTSSGTATERCMNPRASSIIPILARETFRSVIVVVAVSDRGTTNVKF